VGKGKRGNAYLEVRKRRGHIFFQVSLRLKLCNWNVDVTVMNGIMSF
jgi:hypothetical protein